MRRAASGSWRFAHGLEQLPHALLYVRDALRLAAAPGLGVPPRLSEAPPDRSRLLDPAIRSAAAREWTTWWETLVQHESRRHFDSGDGDAHAVHERFLEYHWVLNPETSPALAGTMLRPAALVLFAEGCDWGGRVTPELPDPRDLDSAGQPFAWALVRDTVEAVSAARGVDTADIDGAASVLLVEGDWWDLVAPGFALCSLAAATDPNVAGVLLHSVLESGLTAA